MARPKRTDNTPSVRDRIENAFWKLLSENDYEKISIKMLAAEASVNHNSIYYYYENIDAIATSAFESNVLQDLNLLIRAESIKNIEQLKNLILSQPDVFLRFQRMKLFASANSIYLQQMLKTGLLNTWFTQTNTPRENLSTIDHFELEFIFSAAIALLQQENSLEDLEAFFQGDLGQAVMHSIKRIFS